MHTFEYGDIPTAEDTQFNSVMTYNNQWPYGQDLGMFDLTAIHTLYGVDASARAGANVYTLADCYIWDGGGIDTLDCTGEALRVNIRLTEGSWIWAGTRNSSILADGQVFIGYGTSIERAKGGALADSIQGTHSTTLCGATVGQMCCAAWVVLTSCRAARAMTNSTGARPVTRCMVAWEMI